MRSEMIEGLLDEGATADAGATAVAGATVEVLALLLAEIKPLIGTLALRALYVRSLRLYEITDAGYVIGEPDPEIDALLTGHPRPTSAIASG